MASYKSILDSLLESASTIITAKIRSIKFESSLTKLPASSDSKITLLAQKQFQQISAQVESQILSLLSEWDQQIKEQYKAKNEKQYQRPLTGTKGVECLREQIKEEQEKGLIIMYNKQSDDGESVIKFTTLKEMFAHDSKKTKQVQSLTIDFKSQGITDNSMENFMKKFIQFCNIEELHLNLGCNSLTVLGARQLAGCFTNLNRLTFLDISLYNNKITWEGVDALMHAFQQLYNLKDLSLDVSCNPISNKGFVIIAKALPELRKLRKLWFTAYDIGINDESFKIFNNEFSKIPPLLIAKFDFKVNPFNKKLIQELQNHIHKKKINNYEILA